VTDLDVSLVCFARPLKIISSNKRGQIVVRRTDGSKTKLPLDLIKAGNYQLDVK
jgi:hypothetical protein